LRFRKERQFNWMFQRAVIVYLGMGMKVTGMKTCGDYMFSGHTVMITLLMFFINTCKYKKRVTCDIYNYFSLFAEEFESQSWRGVLDTTLCDNVCQWFAAGRWFYPGTLFSSINKTDRHHITEILLKVLYRVRLAMIGIQTLRQIMKNKYNWKKDNDVFMIPTFHWT
jgi:hypothetical protein